MTLLTLMLNKRDVFRLFHSFFLACAFFAFVAPQSAFALTAQDAQSLVTQATQEINSFLKKGTPKAVRAAAFERVLKRYADLPVIARSALGPRARSASPAQIAAFEKAYTPYLSAKYVSYLADLEDTTVDIVGVRPIKSYYEVTSIVRRPGQRPLEMLWHISDKSGQNRFFNIILEGVNMLASERREIGARLEKSRDDISAMTKGLESAQ